MFKNSSIFSFFSSGPSLALHLLYDEEILFKKHIKNAKNYLEFGSGGSTCFCALTKRVYITSVETSEEWFLKLLGFKEIKSAIKRNKLNLIYADIGETGDWGMPAEQKPREAFLNASVNIFLQNPAAAMADTVFIDGRFRVACALAWLLYRKNKNSIVMVHDFIERPFYHILLDYFDIAEHSSQLVVLTEKQNISLEHAAKDFNRYKYDYR